MGINYRDNARMVREPSDWFSADRALQGKQERKLGYQTWLERDSVGDDIYVRHHRTRIVTFMRDGRVRVTTGGWMSKTTRDRINDFVPWLHLYQRKGEWLMGALDDAEFYDGIVFNADHEVDGPWRGNPSSDNDMVAGYYRGNPETEELEPNWHAMGLWALNGLRFYMQRGELASGVATDASDRKSIVALLATACASAFYVHDIGVDLLSMLGSDRFPDSADDVEDAVKGWVKSKRGWAELRGVVCYQGESGRWGAVANALSESL